MGTTGGWRAEDGDDGDVNDEQRACMYFLAAVLLSQSVYNTDQ